MPICDLLHDRAPQTKARAGGSSSAKTGSSKNHEYEPTEEDEAQKKVDAAVKNGVGHDVWTAVRVLLRRF